MPSGGSPPHEVLAIAVALAVALQEAEVQTVEPVVTEPSPWRWQGRRYRWS